MKAIETKGRKISDLIRIKKKSATMLQVCYLFKTHRQENKEYTKVVKTAPAVGH